MIGARERLIRLRKHLEGQVRGVLRTLGIRLQPVRGAPHHAGFREQLAKAGVEDPVLAILTESFVPVHETLSRAAAAVEAELHVIGRQLPLARR